jgi:hypothetical protein
METRVMTSDIQKRLSGRINILSDFQITVDYENDMIYVHLNRKLDTSITWLKHMSKPQFSTYLNEVTEAYLNHNSK